MRSGANHIPVFTCPLGPRGDMRWVDHAPELRKMKGPPLVRVRYCDVIDHRPGFRLIAPPTPLAIKGVDAVGHLDSRTEKRRSSRPVFFIKLADRAHTNPVQRFLWDGHSTRS